MEAIILAGGLGTRMREAVPDLPKVMALIGGRPFLKSCCNPSPIKDSAVSSWRWATRRNASGLTSANAFPAWIWCMKSRPLPRHRRRLRMALEHCTEDHVFVFNGDTYLDLETAELEQQWQNDHAPILVAREVPDTARYGRLDVAGNRLIGFLEKGQSGPGLINAGCYVLPVTILNEYAPGTPFSLETDFLEKSAGVRRLDLFVTRGRFIDIGIPADYVLAQKLLS